MNALLLIRFSILFLALAAAAAEMPFKCGTCLDPKQSMMMAESLPPLSQGNRRLLLMRMEFSDVPRPAPTEDWCRTTMSYVTNTFASNSYGKFILTYSITPPLQMPGVSTDYTNLYNLLQKAWVEAERAGFRREDFDLEFAIGAATGMNVTGVGFIGARGAYTVPGAGTHIFMHEIGHNLGLSHANTWKAVNDSIVGPGFSQEYGDQFDFMGSSLETFCSYSRYRLGWLPNENVQDTLGTWRVDLTHYEGTSLQPDKVYAARVPAGDRVYWLDCQLPTHIDRLSNAILVRWTPWQSGMGSQLLLPMRVGSPYDGPLALDHTFSDLERKIHITPIQKLQNGFTVQIHSGDFPGNRAPTVTISPAEPVSTSIGSPVSFTASGTDADGDELSYFWDFGDIKVGNGLSVSHTYYMEGEYLVRCEVSDRKGGVSMRSTVVRVGSPQTFRAVGRVTYRGTPLKGARISGGSYEFINAHTGDDGSFVIAGLPTTPIELRAVYGQFALMPKFQNPVTISSNLVGLDFELPMMIEAQARELTINEDSGGISFGLGGTSPVGITGYQITEPPLHGVLVGTPPDLTYTPDPNFFGDDRFTFAVTDSAGDSASAYVQIHVLNQPDPPMLLGQTGAAARAEIVASRRWTLPHGANLKEMVVGANDWVYAAADRMDATWAVWCFNPELNSIWEKFVDATSGLSSLNWMGAVNNGVVIVGGGGGQGAAVALSSSGEERWRYTSSAGTFRTAEYSRVDDTIVISGGNNEQHFLAKINARSGSEVWKTNWTGNFVSRHIDVADAGMIAEIGTVEANSLPTNSFLRVIAADGRVQWTKLIGEPRPDRALRCYVTIDGSVFALHSPADTILTQYDSRGQQLGERSFGDQPVALRFDNGDFPCVLRFDNETAEQGVILERIRGDVRDLLWKGTHGFAPMHFEIKDTGGFEIYTAEPSEGIEITTIGEARVLGSSRIPFESSSLVRPSGKKDATFIGTSSGGVARVIRVVNGATPATIPVPSGAATVISLPLQKIDAELPAGEILVGPARGSLSGVWPNITYEPEAGFVGLDQFQLKAGETVGDVKLRVVNPRRLTPITRDGGLALDYSANEHLEWSSNLKDWFAVRGSGVVSNTPLRFESVQRFFRTRF